MTTFTKSTFIAALIFVCSAVQAQHRSWDLVLSSSDTLVSCSLLEVRDSTLVFSRDSVEFLPVEVVETVIQRKEGSFWSGAGYGAAAGVALGAAVGALSYEKPKPKNDGGYFSNVSFETLGRTTSTLGGGVLGGIAGFAIGGIIGGASGGDDTYDLSGRDLNAKIMMLRAVIKGS